MEQTAIEFGPLFAHQQRLVSRPEDRLSNKRNEPAALSSNFDPHRMAHKLGCRIAQGMANPSRRFGLKGKTWVKSSAQAREARHETQEQEHKLKVVRI